MQDVIMIGGSYAGMAAALQLLRARRKVLIIDAGERRNRYASHSHGFLGQDGVDPAVIHANARDQLTASRCGKGPGGASADRRHRLGRGRWRRRRGGDLA